MKKIICIAMLVASMIVLSGCSSDTYVQHDDTELEEWISPDGVHYWIYSFANKGMLAPRYDSSGNLVID